MDITLAGFILWSWAPYLIALLCLKAKFHPIIVFSAITFALSQDLLYFHQIHLGLRGDTAAFGVLLFRPCFRLLVRLTPFVRPLPFAHHQGSGVP